MTPVPDVPRPVLLARSRCCGTSARVTTHGPVIPFPTPFQVHYRRVKNFGQIVSGADSRHPAKLIWAEPPETPGSPDDVTA
ncbi:hypothetical protein PT974_03516 [Cladobotryum mycophilum]|uniref:Uncharacterized protein n=1 Tax=Cladobotryum mycophilum TaxID=491253 RepID=A0ABR0SSH7_9HYPO